MAETTLEEAKRCPKCQEPGADAGNRSTTTGRRGTRIHVFRCMNGRCRWNNETWVVQVNPDGTIPLPDTTRRNQFERVDPVRAKAAQDAMENLAQATITPNAEIRR